ncbi:Circadian locomoter output cycles protein kaput, partial [Trachymyrmex zeteki]
DIMDDDIDDKDDTKRKSRNLSEKKRRDQFNMLVNELGSMVSANTRKMDKSTVLKSTILFLKNHNEIAVRSRVHEIQEDWKPSFLSNEEFTHLILEALDGFIMVFSSNGHIYYVSESVTSLLGYLPNELENTTIYDITFQEDQPHLYNVLLNPGSTRDRSSIKKEDQISFTCHIKRGGLDFREESIYELVQFIGYFRSTMDSDVDNLLPSQKLSNTSGSDNKLVFVGTGRLQTPQLIRELSVTDSTKSEFTSRHSLEWKFLFLDHRAPPIIGYLPFEVLGTSGYDYYHIDDLDNVVTCHESLMQKGEGTSCYYRFLTKGQQWIWLQTRFYITYNQWNSKPEFIVCTHYVISYVDVMKKLRAELGDYDKTQDVLLPVKQIMVSCQTPLTQWSNKSSRTSKSMTVASNLRHRGDGSNTSSISVSLRSSPQSQITHGSRSNAASASSSVVSKPIASVDSRQQQQAQQQQQQQQLQQQPQHQLDVNQSCINFMDPTQYATVNLQSVVTTGFATPTAPILSTVPTHEMLHQQDIVMTPAQNQIQDELQRKHEELQQLVVHLTTICLKSPLLFIFQAGIPYNPSNPCQQANRCNTNNTNVQLPTSNSVQGVNVLPIPITVPVPIVPTELFSHSLQVNPSSGSTHGNGSSQQEGSNSDLVPFQICLQQAEMIYMEASSNQQQRSSQN